MKLKFLVAAALLGGLVSFAWGTVAHVSGVFPSLEPKAFTDSTRAADAPGERAGEWDLFDSDGIFAAVAFRPDLGQKFQSLAGPMVFSC
jgi:hypothetical protein